MGHPDYDRILGLARGELPSTEESAHLADCERCTGLLAWAENVLRAAATPALAQPPDVLVERAAAIAREELTRPDTRPSLGRRLAQVFARPALGVRGAGAGTRRLYESEGLHLDLEIGEAADDAELCRVTGQLLDATPEPWDALVLLWRRGAIAAHAAADESGTFVLSRVPPGRYRLEVWSPERARVLRVEDFELP